MTAPAPTPTTKDITKETLGILKDALEVAWKIAPVALVPAGLLLWSYLQSVGWIGLFNESAMSGSGLIFLVLAGIIFVFSAIFLFVVPSLLIVCTAHYFDLDKEIPKEAAQLYLIMLLAWFGILFVAFLVESPLPPWVMFGIPVLIGMPYVWAKRDKLDIDGSGTVWTLWSYWKVPGLPAMATFAISGTAFPILLALKIGGQFKGLSNLEEVFVIAMCLLVTLIGTIPGLVYLNMRTSHTGNQRPLKMAFGAVFFVSYVILSAAAFLPPVRSNFLKGAGVYSDSLTSFQVVNKELEFALTAAGMKVTPVDESRTVEAYVRYRFGGVKLLCRDSFDPAAAVPEVESKAGKPTVTKIVAGMGCVPTTAGDVREYTTIPPMAAAVATPAPPAEQK